MRTLLLTCLLSLSFACMAQVAAAQSPTQRETEERLEWEQLLNRFNSRQSYNLFASGMWTLTHAGESKAEVEEVVRLLSLLSKSFEKKDPSLLRELGGAKGFKEKMAGLLNSNDDVVAGFAATMLGISGDLRYAPAVAKLLDKKDAPQDLGERFSRTSSRGRAAVALGLMGASEYVPKFVLMLKSRNRYDRAGAATALGQLGAKERAQDIAAPLNSEEFKFEDDPSPVYALVEMGVAAEYSGDIAKVLQDEFRGDTVKAAVYALAHISARQHAREVAKLLNKQYLKGDAAKALAIMGADEYADEIAKMLNDKSGLNRNDALLALGVMNARKYVSQVAEHLKDPQGFVRYYAAVALILLDAEKYAVEIIPLVENSYREKLYLNADDFNPLVETELVKIRGRFSESFLKMKARMRK
jgi:HEAT repeat protein